MDEHAEDPVGQASQKVVQYASLATMAAEAIAQIRQQRAAASSATDAQAAAAARAARTAELTAARAQWQPMLDGRLRNRSSITDAGLAWVAAQGWREVDPQAAVAADRALERLRELRPDVMERFDRLTGDGVDAVEAMRRVAPFFDRPPARPGDHVPRSALVAGPTATVGDSARTSHALDAPDGTADSSSTAGWQRGTDPAQSSVDSGTRSASCEAPATTVGAATERDIGPSHLRSAAELAKDGFPEPLTGEVLAAGHVRPKAPATTAPAAVRATGLATAARAMSRAR